MKFPEFVKFVNKTLKKKLNPKRNIFQQDVDSIDFTTLLLSIEEKFNMILSDQKKRDYDILWNEKIDNEENLKRFYF